MIFVIFDFFVAYGTTWKLEPFQKIAKIVKNHQNHPTSSKIVVGWSDLDTNTSKTAPNDPKNLKITKYDELLS